MSDTSNQIIQTLEALHEDIKSAKEALKENNVVLESNTTSTLTAEINKIPTAIKESNILEGFNNGKNTLEGGFIYNTDATTLNNATAVLLSANEYKFPEGKTVEIDFPSVEVAYNVWNEKIVLLILKLLVLLAIYIIVFLNLSIRHSYLKDYLIERLITNIESKSI